MGTTRKQIEAWFDQGVKEGATHMIVACDTFDWEDYPVYVKKGENAHDRARNLGEMQKVMECYRLDPAQKQAQLNAFRVFNFD